MLPVSFIGGQSRLELKLLMGERRDYKIPFLELRENTQTWGSGTEVPGGGGGGGVGGGVLG